jgi:hypothetical protein
MTCERYWRDGIALVERGEPDPHRASCEDCRRAHAARNELVHALPLIGQHAEGDPHWQAHVWRRIDRRASPSVVSRYVIGALAAAAVTTAFWLLVGNREERGHGEVAVAPADKLPRIEIISGPVAMRSTSARVGDRVRISAKPDDEIRVYRAEQLMLRCSARQASAGCTRTSRGLVSETTLETAGEYQLVVIKSGAVEPVGKLATDLAAIVAARGDYQLTDLSIR